MRALVTGATGFIGRHLCAALRAAGDDVTALVRPSSNRGALEALGVGFAVGDVNDAASVAAAVDGAGAEVVFHLAAMLGSPWHPDFLRTNAAGVRHIAAACAAAASAPRLVITSSMAASGPSPGRPRVEDDPPEPVSRYGASKLAGEQAARELAARVPITVVRPPIVFGGGDRAMLPVFRLAARGLAVAPGAGAVSLSHVADLVTLIRAAAAGETLAPDGTPGHGVYFGGADESPTIPELARRVAAVVGRRALVVPVPRWVVRAGGAVGELWGRAGGYDLFSRDKAREALAGDWVCSTAKARSQLGWAPAAPLDARLAETAADYRSAGWL
jgi:nucleoside-diphosphate-sugar epimerase